jgi:hypothetical protein
MKKCRRPFGKGCAEDGICANQKGKSRRSKEPDLVVSNKATDPYPANYTK